jgi:hypothetical protein
VHKSLSVRRNLLDSIKEREVDFHLLEDHHHVMGLFSLLPKMKGLYETLHAHINTYIYKNMLP